LIFRGTFEHSLDAKHRLTIPAKYRAELAGRVVLAVSPETEENTPRSIAIWRPADFEAYAEGALADANRLSARRRDLQRAIFNNSFDMELDAANRVMIPTSLMSYAGLDKDVVITGSGDCLEVWDRTAYAAYNEGVLARFTKIAASFDHTA
jgi:MraZ protein